VAVKTLDDAPFVDVFSGEFHGDPASFVDRLRRETGVVRTPIGGLVIRRELVQGLLGDRRLRSSILDIARLQGVTEGVIFELLSHSLLAVEGEAHIRLRKLVNRAFTPRAVDPHRPVMRDILGSLLEPVVPRGHCEFMAEIADHYPIQVMCHLLGVPGEDHDDFTAWNKALTWVLSFELGSHRDEAEWGAARMNEYVGRLIENRRHHPRDDLVTTLVQAEEEGDRLSDWELRVMIGGLLFAGFDTTRNQLGLAMALFAEHPEQWALLAERPELLSGAVEEIMRVQGAVRVAPRVVAEELEVDGYHLSVGTILALSTRAANHDPAAYDDPATFDITIDREPQLTFGGGPHYCLGANLARAEMQEALALLAAHMPGLTLDGQPKWRTPFGIFGPDSLPLRFGQPLT
jgi:cytochrome P450